MTDADGDKLVLVRARAEVTVLTLNRPAARNAMLYESWEALDAAIEDVEGDSSRRGVVLTGAGGYFCAGGDMKTAPAHGSGATAAVGRLAIAHRVINRIRRLSVPVTAAVEGGAAGLGWSLALACDAVVAADDAAFAAPFLRRGVVPDGGAGWLLVQQIGRLRAAEILLSGRPVGAAEALSLGLTSRIVAAGTAVAEACALFADAAGAPNATELTKVLLRAAESATFDSYQNLELTSAALAQAGPDAEAARQSFRQGHRQ